MNVKRVIIRRKAYWRLSDQKGRIVDTVRAKGELRTKASVTNIANRTGTLHINYIRSVNTNIKGETIISYKDLRKNPRVPKDATTSVPFGPTKKTGEVQGYVEITTEDGKFSAVSSKTKSKKEGIRMALRNAARRAAHNYDEDEAKAIEEAALRGEIPINYGIAYYRLG